MNEVVNTALFGTNLFGAPNGPEQAGSTLHERFIVPPFSVLNAREGGWQERKRAWVGLGIQSEVGRGSNALGLSEQAEQYRQGTYERANGKSNLARCYGQDLMRGEHVVGETNREKSFTSCRPHLGNDPRPGRDGGLYEGGDAWLASGNQTGTSIFDPVLCECAYRWFCPAGGTVLYPFAGGSVRGIVAAVLGLKYHGIELRPEQVAANRAQAETICPANPPEWVCGDSLTALAGAPEADFVFTCPPYADLERYSDDPRDLSTMDYHTFVAHYKLIILKACQRLKRDRFACVVVGDVRDGKGIYRNFVADTITAFTGPGLSYYNEAILVTMVGSLPVRISAQFNSGRKLGKTHQNVLVFVKGDPKKATAAIAAGEVQLETA